MLRTAEYVSPKQAAKVLSISYCTMLRVIHRGEIPVFRPSLKGYRIKSSDLAAYRAKRGG